MNKCKAEKREKGGHWFRCTSENNIDCEFNLRNPGICPFKLKTFKFYRCGCYEANLRSCEVR